MEQKGCDMFVKQSVIRDPRGNEHTRCEFESFEDLEKYFIKELLGRSDLRSKVIGKVLIWGKKEK
jgi:hypothetical protein